MLSMLLKIILHLIFLQIRHNSILRKSRNLIVVNLMPENCPWKILNGWIRIDDPLKLIHNLTLTNEENRRTSMWSLNAGNNQIFSEDLDDVSFIYTQKQNISVQFDNYHFREKHTWIWNRQDKILYYGKIFRCFEIRVLECYSDFEKNPTQRKINCDLLLNSNSKVSLLFIF